MIHKQITSNETCPVGILRIIAVLLLAFWGLMALAADQPPSAADLPVIDKLPQVLTLDCGHG